MSRALWVIGATEPNLGWELANLAQRSQTDADDGGRYSWVFASDEGRADVTDRMSLLGYAELIKDSGYNNVDIAYCAGVNYPDPIEDIDAHYMYQTFDVNVMGFIRTLQVAVRLFGREGLSVVAVASDAARTAMRNSITYCASKAALVQAVRVAARELAPGIRVNCVSPAIIADTPMTWRVDKEVQQLRGWTEEQALEYERRMIPMGRRANAGEVAGLILLTLAGPEFLTGANIEITGGK